MSVCFYVSISLSVLAYLFGYKLLDVGLSFSIFPFVHFLHISLQGNRRRTTTVRHHWTNCVTTYRYVRACKCQQITLPSCYVCLLSCGHVFNLSISLKRLETIRHIKTYNGRAGRNTIILFIPTQCIFNTIYFIS